MRIRRILLGMFFAFIVLAMKLQAATIPSVSETNIVPTYERKTDLLVTDIDGLSGIRQIGPFHAGGAIPSNPAFLIETLAGTVLDPERLLVASASNYGLDLYNQQMQPGAILSLEVNQGQYAIPEDFAAQDKKALDGKVMLYSAQNRDYINGYYNSNAVTRDLPTVSNPTYISINNAFGRPWQANSPFGIDGAGLISVSDPNGKPFANAPSIESGGVFFGNMSNRIRGDYQTNTTLRFWLPGNVARENLHQYIPGDLNTGSISTTFLGISPDSTSFAVFSAVGADGSVSQIHVQDGVDGLIKKSVIKPHKRNGTIAGTVFRWTPDFALFITDFYGDRIALLRLTTDEHVYRAQGVSYITSPEIQKPVDIAAVIPEIANPRFSSNTTLAGTSDLYVANQNGTLLRMDQTGKVLAKVKVKTDYENSLHGEIKSISTSYDAQTIFLGMEGKHNHDFIVKIPAFNADGFYLDQVPESSKVVRYDNNAPGITPISTVDLGQQLFSKKFGTEDGIRHVFNANSCVSCHANPIMGGFSPKEENFVRRVSQYNKLTGYFNPIDSHNFPVARRHDVSRFGETPHQKGGIPREANIISLRMPPSLLNIGRLDEIPDYVLISHARSKGDGIQGRVNYIDTKDGKQIGRYGWKADQPTLRHMVADALSSELGLDNPYTIATEMAGTDLSNNGYVVEAITKYLKQIQSGEE
jgi:Di-haem oxidoreductase, putative peroxidase